MMTFLKWMTWAWFAPALANASSWVCGQGMTERAFPSSVSEYRSSSQFDCDPASSDLTELSAQFKIPQPFQEILVNHNDWLEVRNEGSSRAMPDLYVLLELNRTAERLWQEIRSHHQDRWDVIRSHFVGGNSKSRKHASIDRSLSVLRAQLRSWLETMPIIDPYSHGFELSGTVLHPLMNTLLQAELAKIMTRNKGASEFTSPKDFALVQWVAQLIFSQSHSQCGSTSFFSGAWPAFFKVAQYKKLTPFPAFGKAEDQNQWHEDYEKSTGKVAAYFTYFQWKSPLIADSLTRLCGVRSAHPNSLRAFDGRPEQLEPSNKEFFYESNYSEIVQLLSRIGERR